MSTRTYLSSSCIVLAVLSATAVWAQTTEPVLAPHVEELVQDALSGAPSLAAMRARRAAALDQVAPAGALPDPMVGLMLQDIGFPRYTVGSDQMSMIGPEVQQDLPFPGKRAARRDAARAGANVRGAELEQVRRQVVLQVRTLYAGAWALDRERGYLAAAREMLEMLSTTAASRYAAGEGDEEAVLKAQLEVSRVEERLDDLASARATLGSRLNRLLDRPGGAPLGEVATLPVPTPPPPPWEELITRSSAEVAARRAAVEAAEKRVAATRLDLKPDFTTGASVGLRGGYDPAVTLRFGLILPLWRNGKQVPMLRSAEADLEAARAELRDAEAAARADAARLAAEWLRGNRQVERYRQAIVPQTSAAVDAARAAYLVGRGDFLTVVDDFDRWLDARVELARREAERYTTWAELDALLGSAGAAPPPTETSPQEGPGGVR